MKTISVILSLVLLLADVGLCAPTFSATAGVVFAFTGASNSTSRTIPTANAVALACEMFDATGDTMAGTIAGAAPTESFLTASGADRIYIAVFYGAPSGAQTVALSGGDVGDSWGCGYRGLDGGHSTDPFNGSVTDTASPLSIDVVTTSDGLAFGCINTDDNTVSTSDTEVFEQGAANPVLNCASTGGTGGTVSLDWSGGGTAFISAAVNLLNADAAVATTGVVSTTPGTGSITTTGGTGRLNMQ